MHENTANSLESVFGEGGMIVYHPGEEALRGRFRAISGEILGYYREESGNLGGFLHELLIF